MEKFFQGFVVDKKGRIMKGFKSAKDIKKEPVEEWAERTMQRNHAIDRIIIMEAVGVVSR